MALNPTRVGRRSQNANRRSCELRLRDLFVRSEGLRPPCLRRRPVASTAWLINSPSCGYSLRYAQHLSASAAVRQGLTRPSTVPKGIDTSIVWYDLWPKCYMPKGWLSTLSDTFGQISKIHRLAFRTRSRGSNRQDLA